MIVCLKINAESILLQKNTFDLQGQMDKIARFEEKLRSAHSSAVFPNFMAAKWREQYERKRQKERESRMNHRNGREEGEMTEIQPFPS